jgi:hypothetical protein
MGTSKNSEFAQMPHKGTPIRYGQKQPVRNRQQGVEVGLAGKPRSGCSQNISSRRIWVIGKQEIFYATRHNQRLGCRLLTA